MAPKKPFSELSTVAQFHTFPDLYGDYLEVSSANADLMEFIFRIREGINDKLSNNEGIKSPEGDHLKKLIEKVLNIELSADGKEIKGEKEKVDRAKEKIKEQVKIVIGSIKEYMKTIISLAEAGRKGTKFDIEKEDFRRRQSHNALISNINILNRSLLWWFGNFDPNLLSDKHFAMYENQEEQYISKYIKRIDMPQSGICPSKIDIKERKAITKWATDIYLDLNKLEFLSRASN